MATDFMGELGAFNQFVLTQHAGSLPGHSLEEALLAFRQYQQQLAVVRSHVQESIQSAELEGTRALDDQTLAEKFQAWQQKIEQVENPPK